MDVQTIKLTVTKVELIEAFRKRRNAVCKKENTDRSTKITADEVMLSILHRLITEEKSKEELHIGHL